MPERKDDVKDVTWTSHQKKWKRTIREDVEQARDVIVCCAYKLYARTDSSVMGHARLTVFGKVAIL